MPYSSDSCPDLVTVTETKTKSLAKSCAHVEWRAENESESSQFNWMAHVSWDLGLYKQRNVPENKRNSSTAHVKNMKVKYD